MASQLRWPPQPHATCTCMICFYATASCADYWWISGPPSCMRSARGGLGTPSAAHRASADSLDDTRCGTPRVVEFTVAHFLGALSVCAHMRSGSPCVFPLTAASDAAASLACQHYSHDCRSDAAASESCWCHYDASIYQTCWHSPRLCLVSSQGALPSMTPPPSTPSDCDSSDGDFIDR